MADLNTKTFTQLVEGMAAQVQARAAGLIDFTVGTVIRSLTESVAALTLWLQAQILAVLGMSRASTSVGADLDSWIADFGGPFVENGLPTITRIPAVAATGDVTFTRLTATGTALITPGASVETLDGSQRYVVVEDTENAYWSPADGGYLMGNLQATISVPVMALVGGSAGNATAGQISVITSPMPGIDQVTNPLDFDTGADAESDEALRVRFRAFIQSLADGTPAAIIFWVKAMGANVSAAIVEYQDLNGTPHAAYFYAVVDDGKDVVDPDFLAAATAQVDLHRAAGIEFDVYLRDLVPANVTLDITVANPGDAAFVRALVDDAITDYINSLVLGEDLSFNRLYQVVYAASPLVLDVDNLLVNSGTANVVAAPVERIVAGTVVAS